MIAASDVTRSRERGSRFSSSEPRNLLSELAIFDRMRSLHIYTAINPLEKSGRAPVVRAGAEAAGAAADGAIIDLSPLIPLARSSNATLDPDLRRLILGFDLFVFFRDAEPGSYERLRTPNFRWYPDQP